MLARSTHPGPDVRGAVGDDPVNAEIEHERYVGRLVHGPYVDLPTPGVRVWRPSLKTAVRSAIDWETVTPLDELPVGSFSARVKKGLRWWRQRQRAEAER